MRPPMDPARGMRPQHGGIRLFAMAAIAARR
jgi:hypothetical protein